MPAFIQLVLASWITRRRNSDLVIPSRWAPKSRKAKSESWRRQLRERITGFVGRVGT